MTFTDPVPASAVVGAATKLSALSAVYANTFYLRDAIEPATLGGETIAVGEWCYQAETTSGGNTVGRWYRLNAANEYSSSQPNLIGFCIAAMTNGTTGRVRRAGVVSNGEFGLTLTGLSPGSLYYATNSAGAISTTPGTVSQIVAVAVTATSLAIAGEYAFLPSTVKSALALTPTGSGALVLAAGPTIDSLTLTTPLPVASGGSGQGTFRPVLFLNGQYTQVGNVGTGLDDLMTYALPAGILDTDGRSIRVTAWGKCPNSTGTKGVYLSFGSITVCSALFASSDGTRDWRLEAHIMRTGATTQKSSGAVFINGGGSSVSPQVLTDTAGVEALSGSITVKCQASGTNDNDVVQHGMTIELL